MDEYGIIIYMNHIEVLKHITYLHIFTNSMPYSSIFNIVPYINILNHIAMKSDCIMIQSEFICYMVVAIVSEISHDISHIRHLRCSIPKLMWNYTWFLSLPAFFSKNSVDAAGTSRFVWRSLLMARPCWEPQIRSP